MLGRIRRVAGDLALGMATGSAWDPKHYHDRRSQGMSRLQAFTNTGLGTAAGLAAGALPLALHATNPLLAHGLTLAGTAAGVGIEKLADRMALKGKSKPQVEKALYGVSEQGAKNRGLSGGDYELLKSMTGC